MILREERSGCLAQNGNNTTDLDKCPRTIGSLDSAATANSTGKVALRFDAPPNEDWFFSVTLNDARSSVLVSMLHDFQGYLSFPQSTTTGRGWSINLMASKLQYRVPVRILAKVC
jgi:hypothetical protein